MTQPARRNPIDPSKIVFSAPEIATQTTQQIDRERARKSGIPTGIATLDAHFLPLRPGRLIPVLGTQGNFKSGLMLSIARNALQYIDPETEIAVYVTWEQSIEDQGMFDFAQISRISATSLYAGNVSDAQWGAVLNASAKRAEQPLWMIGHSSEGTKENRRRPMLTMTDVEAALAYIEDYQGKKVRLLVLDYLQRVNRADKLHIHGTREQYMSIVDDAKNLALQFSTPVLIGSQVSREVVKERKWKLPQAEDGMETSNLEHSADQMLSVWMPKNNPELGPVIEVNGAALRVTPNTLIIGTLKQKFAAYPFVSVVDVIPQENLILPYGTVQNDPKFYPSK